MTENYPEVLAFQVCILDLVLHQYLQVFDCIAKAQHCNNDRYLLSPLS